MKNIKYIYLLAIAFGFTACNDEEDYIDTPEPAAALPTLTAGSANFSNYVAIGNSLTAGFTDNALFIAGQENSMTNMLANKFALVGGGSFNQPLMSDNFGGVMVGTTRVLEPRLVFNGSGPAPLESLIGPVTPATNLLTNNPTGPFNNMGVPGARAAHLIYDGYGNLANLGVSANPYFIRMASTPTATILGDAMAQAPSFFSLWIGNNDVLGYATSGGDGSSPITPLTGPIGVGFEDTYNYIASTLASGSTQGVLANIPDITTIPHFTTVPYNAVPLDAATATVINNGYAAYNGGLVGLETLGAISADELAARTINFSEGQNAVVIEDEDLTDLLTNYGLPSYRQATEADLLVLSSSSFIGTLVGGNPSYVNGVSVPLADHWVLTPEEQLEIADATTAFNQVIQTAASNLGLAFVDVNSIMTNLANGGTVSGEYVLTSDLVTGGAFSLDGVHPTARGYSFLANAFMTAIDVTYGSNFEASGSLLNVADYQTNYSPLLQ